MYKCVQSVVTTTAVAIAGAADTVGGTVGIAAGAAAGGGAKKLQADNIFAPGPLALHAGGLYNETNISILRC